MVNKRIFNCIFFQNETPLHSCDDASIYNANLGSETPWHDTDYDNPPSVRMVSKYTCMW